MDPFGRHIDYLRISVADRCNERCLYCMPEGYKGWAQKADHLTADEVVRIVENSTGLGFRKFRLTGGEPLVRKDIVEIARRIRDLPGVQTLDPSTDKPPGHGPARYYQLRSNGAHVGFIGSVTCADFCKDCNKLRLTADGKLRPCLGRHGEIDLMPALRSGSSVATGISDALHEAIANKPENHSFADDFEVSRPMTAIGG